MEPECSLPRLQVLATCPYSEPDQTSPCPSIPLLKDPSLHYPSIYAWVFPVVSFLQACPPKPFIHLSSPPYMQRSSSISFLSFPKATTCLIELTSYRSPFTGNMGFFYILKTLRVIITAKLVTRKVFRG